VTYGYNEARKELHDMFLSVVRSIIPPVLFRDDPGNASHEAPRPLRLEGLRAGQRAEPTLPSFEKE